MVPNLIFEKIGASSVNRGNLAPPFLASTFLGFRVWGLGGLKWCKIFSMYRMGTRTLATPHVGFRVQGTKVLGTCLAPSARLILNLNRPPLDVGGIQNGGPLLYPHKRFPTKMYVIEILHTGHLSRAHGG